MFSMELLVICMSFSVGLRLTRGAAHCPTSWSVKNSHNCEIRRHEEQAGNAGRAECGQSPEQQPGTAEQVQARPDLKHDPEIPALSEQEEDRASVEQHAKVATWIGAAIGRP